MFQPYAPVLSHASSMGVMQLPQAMLVCHGGWLLGGMISLLCSLWLGTFSKTLSSRAICHMLLDLSITQRVWRVCSIALTGPCQFPWLRSME